MKRFLFCLVVLYILTIAYFVGVSPAKSEAAIEYPNYHEQLAQITGILLRIERKLK